MKRLRHRAQVVQVELPGEVVAVVEPHRAAPDVDALAHLQVLRQVPRRLRGEHGGDAVHEVALPQRAALHEDGPGVAARVAAVRLAPRALGAKPFGGRSSLISQVLSAR